MDVNPKEGVMLHFLILDFHFMQICQTASLLSPLSLSLKLRTIYDANLLYDTNLQMLLVRYEGGFCHGTIQPCEFICVQYQSQSHHYD